MQTEAELIDFLATRADERWKDGEPYYLSLVATELTEKDVNYRTIIGEETLKNFVRRVAEHSSFKIIEHETQRAKVVIVPNNADFAFSETMATTRTAPSIRIGDQAGEQALLLFLKALARLPDSSLKDFSIPATILTKLVSRR